MDNNEHKHMMDLKFWTIVSKGIYRFVVAANCCYEIHIIHHSLEQSIIDADANLYISGDWYDVTKGINYFSRELIHTGCVKECLENAKKDYIKNT